MNPDIILVILNPLTVLALVICLVMWDRSMPASSWLTRMGVGIIACGLILQALASYDRLGEVARFDNLGPWWIAKDIGMAVTTCGILKTIWTNRKE